MYKHIVSIIALSMTLTVSNLHAGLDSWVSSVLPKSMRTSKDTRAIADEAKKIMGIKHSVLLKNGKNYEATNVAPFSWITIDEKDLENRPNNQKIHIIYHETAHAFHKHDATRNTLIYSTSLVSMCAATWIIEKAPVSLPRKSILGLSTALLPLFAIDRCVMPENSKKTELQADTTAALYLAKAGHIDLLKEDLIKFKNYRLNGVRGWQRERGQDYPTVNQNIYLKYEALKAVDKLGELQNDPELLKAIAEMPYDEQNEHLHKKGLANK